MKLQLRVTRIFTLLLIVGVSTALRAHAQEITTPYPKMAPFDQYLMERTAEILLARMLRRNRFRTTCGSWSGGRRERPPRKAKTALSAWCAHGPRELTIQTSGIPSCALRSASYWPPLDSSFSHRQEDKARLGRAGAEPGTDKSPRGRPPTPYRDPLLVRQPGQDEPCLLDGERNEESSGCSLASRQIGARSLYFSKEFWISSDSRGP